MITTQVWKAAAIGLLVAVVALAGTNAYTGMRLLSTTTELGHKREEVATVRGELAVQNEKVSSLAKETAAAKERYKAAVAAAGSNDKVAKGIHALAATIKGQGCKDAMPVVDKVLEATR